MNGATVVFELQQGVCTAVVGLQVACFSPSQCSEAPNRCVSEITIWERQDAAGAAAQAGRAEQVFPAAQTPPPLYVLKLDRENVAPPGLV